MANGDSLPGSNSESDKFVICSGVRSGLKREFAFALKSQAELAASLGRTRSRNSKRKRSVGENETPILTDGRSEVISTPPPSLPPLQLHAGSNSETPIMIDGDDEPKVENDAEPKEMEMNISKKIGLTKLPSNVRELLMTGLLDGLSIKYLTGTDKHVGLQGMIKDGRIFCYCNSCKGVKAVSAYQFERHAGSTKKRPSDFICLENGKTINDVLEACKAAPLDMLESSIEKLISPVPLKKGYTCQNCKGSFHTSLAGKFTLLCDSCFELNQTQTVPSTLNGTNSSARSLMSVLVSDSSNSTSKKISLRKKVTFGKLTKKYLGLHKLVFMGDTLPEGTVVRYVVHGQIALQGSIQDSGILCSCCKKVVSPSQFEAHAGEAQRRKPYNNIYVSNGVSLHELSVCLSKDRKLSNSENDDLCSICADGGNLLCCDYCTRVFHRECVGLSSIPKGKWRCPYCQNMHQREKFVEHNDNAVAAGRVAGVDPIEQIFKRCIRIAKTPETNVGGCVFCRRHDCSNSGFGPRTVILCDQCEKEHHVGCLKAHNLCDLKELPETEWFCCTDCSRIYAALQEVVLQGEESLPDLDSDIIKRKCEEKGLIKDANVDIRWRLLSGKTLDADSNLLLSRAVSIFHELFDPIVDCATGRNLIPAMVYGRKFSDEWDYRGMYCAVLTVGSNVLSAGILRVLGTEVAELPLVATSRESQGLGCFQSLFSCIERLLASLRVKHLVLPAAEEAESIWTKKFGFTQITTDQLHKYAKGARTMIFQGTSVLHKPVPIFDVS